MRLFVVRCLLWLLFVFPWDLESDLNLNPISCFTEKGRWSSLSLSFLVYNMGLLDWRFECKSDWHSTGSQKIELSSVLLPGVPVLAGKGRISSRGTKLHFIGRNGRDRNDSCPHVTPLGSGQKRNPGFGLWHCSTRPRPGKEEGTSSVHPALTHIPGVTIPSFPKSTGRRSQESNLWIRHWT